MSLQTPDAIRTLQSKLYGKAKTEPNDRFFIFYDKVWRMRPSASAAIRAIAVSFRVPQWHRGVGHRRLVLPHEKYGAGAWVLDRS